jgi:hypothetical protein
MTNRAMVTPEAAKGDGPQPNRDPLPPMPAPEAASNVATDREPVDSPHLNEEMQRRKDGGLSTDKR